MFVVDTNVLIYAANVDCPEHARCRAWVEKWRAQPTAWYVTWGVLYEFLRVITHPRVLPRPWKTSEAMGFVHSLVNTSSLQILSETERHLRVAAEVFREVPQASGNLIHDAHTAILMKEHGIRHIYTRDAEFHRFPFLEVTDPLKE